MNFSYLKTYRPWIYLIAAVLLFGCAVIAATYMVVEPKVEMQNIINP